jgi:hypothetical protein
VNKSYFTFIFIVSSIINLIVHIFNFSLIIGGNLFINLYIIILLIAFDDLFIIKYAHIFVLIFVSMIHYKNLMPYIFTIIFYFYCSIHKSYDKLIHNSILIYISIIHKIAVKNVILSITFCSMIYSILSNILLFTSIIIFYSYIICQLKNLLIFKAIWIKFN